MIPESIVLHKILNLKEQAMSEELESLVPHLLTILAAQRCFAYSKFID
jgi:hypothetical protein